MELTEPFDVTVVVTAHSAERPAPKRTSLPFHRPGRLIDAHPGDRRIASRLHRDAKDHHRQVDRQHRREDDDGKLLPPGEVAEHDDHRHRNDGDRPGLDEVRERRRVLVRMRRVRAEVAAAVGAKLLDRHHARRDTSGDLLLRAFDRRRRRRRLERLRRPLPDHEDGHQQRQRQEEPDGRARQVNVEVAKLLQPVAGQASNDGDRGGHARRRRHELQERDHEHLRQVRQARFAAVVLQVRVGHEARDRVERERRFLVADAVRIEGQVLLQRHDRPGREPHEDVRDQQRERIALPVLLIVRIGADEAQHQLLDRHEDRIEPRALAGEEPDTCSRQAACWWRW